MIDEISKASALTQDDISKMKNASKDSNILSFIMENPSIKFLMQHGGENSILRFEQGGIKFGRSSKKQEELKNCMPVLATNRKFGEAHRAGGRCEGNIALLKRQYVNKSI